MLYIEPNAGVAPLIQMIDSAQPGGELMLNFYYLADRRVLKEITRAVETGVRVYVIVEADPYEITAEKVAEEIQALKATGALVQTTPARFRGQDGSPAFDHAKYAVSHDEVLIGTANIDYSAFSRNREYIVTSTDPTLAKALETLFVGDWSGRDADDEVRSTAPDLVLSPGAADQIVAQIEQPGNICMEVEELGSDGEILAAIQAKGTQASLVVPDGMNEAKRDELSALAGAGVNVRVLPKSPLYLHAKLIVGQTSAYVGSQNFSETSLANNREVGIILQDQSSLQTLSTTCQQDLRDAQPLE